MSSDASQWQRADFDALSIPKYKRLELLLREQIRHGTYRPGSRLPTEKELMAEHQLSYDPARPPTPPRPRP